MLIIGSGTDKTLRLKSYRASTVGSRSTLTITLETDDHWELAYALRALAEIEVAQKARAAEHRAAERKTKSKPQAKAPLALPAPARRLPFPEDL